MCKKCKKASAERIEEHYNEVEAKFDCSFYVLNACKRPTDMVAKLIVIAALLGVAAAWFSTSPGMSLMRPCSHLLPPRHARLWASPSLHLSLARDKPGGASREGRKPRKKPTPPDSIAPVPGQGQEKKQDQEQDAAPGQDPAAAGLAVSEATPADHRAGEDVSESAGLSPQPGALMGSEPTPNPNPIPNLLAPGSLAALLRDLSPSNLAQPLLDLKAALSSRPAPLSQTDLALLQPALAPIMELMTPTQVADTVLALGTAVQATLHPDTGAAAAWGYDPRAGAASQQLRSLAVCLAPLAIRRLGGHHPRPGDAIFLPDTALCGDVFAEDTDGAEDGVRVGVKASSRMRFRSRNVGMALTGLVRLEASYGDLSAAQRLDLHGLVLDALPGLTERRARSLANFVWALGRLGVPLGSGGEASALLPPLLRMVEQEFDATNRQSRRDLTAKESERRLDDHSLSSLLVGLHAAGVTWADLPVSLQSVLSRSFCSLCSGGVKISSRALGNTLWALGRMGFVRAAMTERVAMAAELGLRAACGRMLESDVVQIVQGLAAMGYRWSDLSPDTREMLAGAVYTSRAAVWAVQGETCLVQMATLFLSLARLEVRWTDIEAHRGLKAALFVGVKAAAGAWERAGRGAGAATGGGGGGGGGGATRAAAAAAAAAEAAAAARQGDGARALGVHWSYAAPDQARGLASLLYALTLLRCPAHALAAPTRLSLFAVLKRSLVGSLDGDAAVAAAVPLPLHERAHAHAHARPAEQSGNPAHFPGDGSMTGLSLSLAVYSLGQLGVRLGAGVGASLPQPVAALLLRAVEREAGLLLRRLRGAGISGSGSGSTADPNPNLTPGSAHIVGEGAASTFRLVDACNLLYGLGAISNPLPIPRLDFEAQGGGRASQAEAAAAMTLVSLSSRVESRGSPNPNPNPSRGSRRAGEYASVAISRPLAAVATELLTALLEGLLLRGAGEAGAAGGAPRQPSTAADVSGHHRAGLGRQETTYAEACVVFLRACASLGVTWAEVAPAPDEAARAMLLHLARVGPRQSPQLRAGGSSDPAPAGSPGRLNSPKGLDAAHGGGSHYSPADAVFLDADLDSAAAYFAEGLGAKADRDRRHLPVVALRYMCLLGVGALEIGGEALSVFVESLGGGGGGLSGGPRRAGSLNPQSLSMLLQALAGMRCRAGMLSAAARGVMLGSFYAVGTGGWVRSWAGAEEGVGAGAGARAEADGQPGTRYRQIDPPPPTSPPSSSSSSVSSESPAGLPAPADYDEVWGCSMMLYSFGKLGFRYDDLNRGDHLVDTLVSLLPAHSPARLPITCVALTYLGAPAWDSLPASMQIALCSVLAAADGAWAEEHIGGVGIGPAGTRGGIGARGGGGGARGDGKYAAGPTDRGSNKLGQGRDQGLHYSGERLSPQGAACVLKLVHHLLYEGPSSSTPPSTLGPAGADPLGLPPSSGGRGGSPTTFLRAQLRHLAVGIVGNFLPRDGSPFKGASTHGRGDIDGAWAALGAEEGGGAGPGQGRGQGSSSEEDEEEEEALYGRLQRALGDTADPLEPSAADCFSRLEARAVERMLISLDLIDEVDPRQRLALKRLAGMDGDRGAGAAAGARGSGGRARGVGGGGWTAGAWAAGSASIVDVAAEAQYDVRVTEDGEEVTGELSLPAVSATGRPSALASVGPGGESIAEALAVQAVQALRDTYGVEGPNWSWCTAEQRCAATRYLTDTLGGRFQGDRGLSGQGSLEGVFAVLHALRLLEVTWEDLPTRPRNALALAAAREVLAGLRASSNGSGGSGGGGGGGERLPRAGAGAGAGAWPAVGARGEFPVTRLQRAVARAGIKKHAIPLELREALLRAGLRLA